ncbi:hypothetical protein RGQ29_012472 [Quercus rubra]|uniref:HMG box domain-containing protein n=1 Tax=Quercus rubra TaxID=3512 RepID=A0AAN7JAD8_QUERU|nr:hypothetical protein RGQ29_012472 [Quercus rubra]
MSLFLATTHKLFFPLSLSATSETKMTNDGRDISIQRKSKREEMEVYEEEKTNPGIAFTEVGRVLGDKWKKMTVEEKEPYEAKAQQDKKRYKDEISGYKNPQPMNIDSGNESDSA